MAGKLQIFGSAAVCALLSVVLALPVTTAFGHGDAPHDAESHAAQDDVEMTTSDIGRLEAFTRQATAGDAARARAGDSRIAEQVGRWSGPTPWPVVAIHTALMPDGKVLAYDSIDFANSDEHNHTRATLWDPATGTHTPAWVIGHNIFCSGLAHLPDGSLFTAGGNEPDPPPAPGYKGIVQTYTFNSSTQSWTMGADMAAQRWYPSITGMPNGEMLITEGTLQDPLADTPEVRATDGSLRLLPGGTADDLELYPWFDVAPDGRAFYSGPNPRMRSLNTSGAGSWQAYGLREENQIVRDYGSRAMYDIGKILVTGGEASQRSSQVIDINGATPQSSPTDPMAIGRRQHNLTVLADGQVLATGGNSSGVGLVDLDNGVYPAELWNPVTGRWRTLASMQVTRQYHSTALLLPDGRVLSAGGGICGDCDLVGYLAQNAEIFSPPYLFKKDGSDELAPRPSIQPAAAVANYGAQLDIEPTGPSSVTKLALARLGAVTHSVNMDQRYVPLSFTRRGDGVLSATTPANANIAPPGVYMLFAIDANGVPSVAKMVTLSATAPPAPAIPEKQAAQLQGQSGGGATVARTCKVPSLKGKSRNSARKALSAAGCSLGATKKKALKRFTKKQRRNRVRSQSVRAAKVIAAGTKVSITINVKKAKK